MTWLAVLLTASLGATLVASGDGQPPVTIIEIPVATATSVPGSTAPRPSTPSTSPAPATSSPAIEDLVLPTETEPFSLWLAVAVLALGGLVALALLRRRNGFPDASARPTVSETGPATAAVPPLAIGPYQAVEYRSEPGSSQVQQHTLGEFTTLEAAVDTARLARIRFDLNSATEAFWVVWNLHLKRAVWIAEAGTPGESVIDLRTGRRQPYPAESSKT